MQEGARIMLYKAICYLTFPVFHIRNLYSSTRPVVKMQIKPPWTYIYENAFLHAYIYVYAVQHFRS